MNDGFAWWLIVVGIAIGVGLVWVFVIRLPRSEADVGASETPIEAEWISRNIETYGGLAPQPLVEEVLELHRQYLVTGATPLPPIWRPSPDDFRTETAAPAPIPEPAETIVSGVAPEPEPEVVSDDAPVQSPSDDPLEFSPGEP